MTTCIIGFLDKDRNPALSKIDLANPNKIWQILIFADKKSNCKQRDVTAINYPMIQILH